MVAFWVTLALIAISLFLLDYVWKPKLTLPCPARIPLLGHVLSISDKLPLDFDNWGKQLGSLCEIQLVNKNFVVLNDYDILDEMMSSGLWEVRSKTFRYSAWADVEQDRSPKDIFGQDATEHQQTMKKLAWNEILKIKQSPLFNAVGSLTYRNLIKQIKEKSIDHVLDPYDIIRDECAKFLYGLVRGRPVQDSDPNMVKINNLMEIVRVDLNFKGNELELMPWLKYVGHQGYKHLKEGNKIMKELAADVMADMQANGLKDGLGPGFINAADSLDLPDSVKASVLWNDFFIGGAIPLPPAIYAMYMILASHPDVQQQIRSETSSWFRRVDDAVTAKECHCSHYTRAAVWELLRYISPVPMTLREAAEDTTLGGTSVPKGTQVFVNFYCPHHNEVKWEDPWKYKPERFLTESRKLVAVDDPKWKNLKPFGAGKKMCLGWTLVIDILMVFTAWIVQNYQVQCVEGKEVPTDVREWPDYGLGFLPKRSELKFVPIERRFYYSKVQSVKTESSKAKV